MPKCITAAIFLSILSLPAAQAQMVIVPEISEMSEQQRADELSAMQFYLETLTTLESLKYITRTAKNSTRPSDLAEALSGAEGSGRLLRGISESLKLLAENTALQPPAWVDRWERVNGSTGLIRKMAALINMSAEFVEAVQNAETATAEEKLKSLANMIENVNKLLPPNTPVGAYIGVVADIVEGIARDAAIIEDATRRKNDAIELVNRLLVGEEYETIPEDFAAEKIAALERRIERIEAQEAIALSESAYQKRAYAEEICAQQRNLNRPEISQLRRDRAATSRKVRNIETMLEMDRVLLLELKNRISLSALNLADALRDQTGNDISKALNAVNRIVRFEVEKAMYEAELRQLERRVAERKGLLEANLMTAKAEIREFQAFFEGFFRCVDNILESQGEIIGLSYLKMIRSDGDKESILISVSGNFAFPITAVLSPRSCPSGFSCGTEIRTIGAPLDGPTLEMIDALWCTGVTTDWEMDYQVHIEDANGYKSNAMGASLVCLGN